KWLFRWSCWPQPECWFEASRILAPVISDSAVNTCFWSGSRPTTLKCRGTRKLWIVSQSYPEFVVSPARSARHSAFRATACFNAVGEAPEPYLYLAYWPNIESEITYLIETSTDPTALAPVARHVLKSVDPHLDPLSITTENDLIRYSAQSYQVTAELVGALGL